MDEFVKKIAQFLYSPIKTDKIFLQNYNDMKSANTIGADKYFHAKANCESAQKASPLEAALISDTRELLDSTISNPFIKKLPLKENISDCLDDLRVDGIGLYRGLMNKDANCRGLLKDLRPNGLDEKY